MKKVSVLVIALFSICFSQNAFSQSKSHVGASPVEVGSTILNLGIGVGANYKGENYNTAFGFKAALEFGLWEAGPGVITLGPEIGSSISTGNYQSYNYDTRTFIIAARSAWHFGWNVPNLDTYGGFSGGIGFHHYDNGNDPSSSTVIPVFGVFVGASYFVSPTFGFNAEAGYDITAFQAGVVFKFN